MGRLVMITDRLAGSGGDTSSMLRCGVTAHTRKSWSPPGTPVQTARFRRSIPHNDDRS